MSVAAFCSEDNKNSAHRPDQFNPEWYVQTPADSIVITTTNVSPAKQAYIYILPLSPSVLFSPIHYFKNAAHLIIFADKCLPWGDVFVGAQSTG